MNKKIIYIILAFIAVLQQGCVTTQSTAYLENPQKIKVRTPGADSQPKTFIIIPDTTEGTKEGSRYKKYSKYLQIELEKLGYSELSGSGSIPDEIQMIFFHYDIGLKDFDVNSPTNTNCRKTYDGEFNCRTTGGTQSHTLVSTFLKITAFDLKAGAKEKRMLSWILKTILHQTDPYFRPDVVVENMIKNLSPYLGRNTHGEIEVPYP